jgi:hypothetical protein
MADIHERRKAPRYTVSGGLSGEARPTMDVRLVDLSASGGRIEHSQRLPAGVVCAFEFPPSVGRLVLHARVVHCAVVGAEQNPEGERHLRYQSGLDFLGVMPDQQALLDAVLQRITPGGGLGTGRLFF